MEAGSPTVCVAAQLAGCGFVHQWALTSSEFLPHGAVVIGAGLPLGVFLVCRDFLQPFLSFGEVRQDLGPCKYGVRKGCRAARNAVGRRWKCRPRQAPALRPVLRSLIPPEVGEPDEALRLAEVPWHEKGGSTSLLPQPAGLDYWPSS